MLQRCLCICQIPIYAAGAPLLIIVDSLTGRALVKVGLHHLRGVPMLQTLCSEDSSGLEPCDLRVNPPQLPRL
jgi:hypothetical protein